MTYSRQADNCQKAQSRARCLRYDQPIRAIAGVRRGVVPRSEESYRRRYFLRLLRLNGGQSSR